MQEALAKIESVLTPCGEEFASRAVAKLAAVTAVKDGSEDLGFKIEAISELVANFPEDSVIYAYKNLVDKKWFPVWAEWKYELDWHAGERRFARDAIMRALQS